MKALPLLVIVLMSCSPWDSLSLRQCRSCSEDARVTDANVDAAAALQENGGSCSVPGDCDSGFCADGVCCDALCDGPCEACIASSSGVTTGVCGAVIRDTDPNDECSDAGCGSGVCSGLRTCEPKVLGTVCRPSVGNCDEVDRCDGVSLVCPADDVVSRTVSCRPSAGPCDVPEECDGLNPTCPVDHFVPAGIDCRSTAGVCDLVDRCSGTNAECPDVRVEAGQVCRASLHSCDRREACDGSSVDCPADTAESSGAVCRPAVSACDVSEVCDGTQTLCPADAVLARSSISDCAPYRCDGIAPSCASNCTTDLDCAERSSCTLGQCVAWKRVFATSEEYLADLGGLAGADQICAEHAAGAGLSGTFKAWLSSSTASAGTRLTHSSASYFILREGTPVIVATSWADLTRGGIRAAINSNEFGSAIVGPYRYAWTATTPNGNVAYGMPIYTCNDWTSAAVYEPGGPVGFVGNTQSVNSQWSDQSSWSCSVAASLYCFEQ